MNVNLNRCECECEAGECEDQDNMAATLNTSAQSDYERALMPLESAERQQLSARLADAALPRLLAACDAFEPQQEGSWCCLAAFVTALRTLATLEPQSLSSDITAAYSQEGLFEIERRARNMPSTARALPAGVSLAEGEMLLADLGLQVWHLPYPTHSTHARAHGDLIASASACAAAES